ncbi:C-C motif chemokine 3-like [Globicephala melas]|uniref:C-C motif chemokine 3-like n=1 Tax=Globicephala melas TaxID=9731 RepID=UPI00062B7D21|nr:C-C motif chemokine 3-like [Globicephala melas]
MEVPGATLAVPLLSAAPRESVLPFFCAVPCRPLSPLSGHGLGHSAKILCPSPDQSVLFLTVGANTPTACCFSYISWQIPCKFMDDYYETSRQCSKPSVIFQTKRGQEVCADPNEDRVQEYITDLELSA